jgi:hypothetical protein
MARAGYDVGTQPQRPAVLRGGASGAVGIVVRGDDAAVLGGGGQLLHGHRWRGECGDLRVLEDKTRGGRGDQQDPVDGYGQSLPGRSVQPEQAGQAVADDGAVLSAQRGEMAVQFGQPPLKVWVVRVG